MADTKSYYYLKIKENFFDTEDMKLLESLDNGYLYSNILMKMYLLSLKNGGKLFYKDRIPYNSKMLATILNHNVDVIEQAIIKFRELNLIEIQTSGAIFMLDIQNYIGKSSDEADRKRDYRLRIEASGQMSGHISNILKIENKDIDKDIDNTPTFKKPTILEIKEYCQERNNNVNTEKFYNFYESKGWMIGKNKMKDWQACVRTWENADKDKPTDKVPEWFNKEIKTETISTEEEQKMKAMLSEFS